MQFASQKQKVCINIYKMFLGNSRDNPLIEFLLIIFLEVNTQQSLHTCFLGLHFWLYYHWVSISVVLQTQDMAGFLVESDSSSHANNSFQISRHQEPLQTDQHMSKSNSPFRGRQLMKYERTSICQAFCLFMCITCHRLRLF